jgi:DNA-binding transcriptional LysR family regulator
MLDGAMRPDLAGINLNLLVTLDALLTEGGVTKAATRLGVTQSAVSHSLRQLRELLGDPLFVRGRGGLVPTPYAERLALPLRRGLTELRRALTDDGGFDPATSRRRFTLASGDAFAVMLLPGLLAGLRAGSPGIDLDVVPTDRTTAALLENGLVDAAVGVSFADAPGLRQRKLFEEGFACLARAGHPDIPPAGLDLDTWCALPHALISPSGEGQGVVDAALARLGRQRRVALRVRYFLAAPLLIAESDLVLTLPRRVAASFAGAFGLRVYAPPVALPSFTVHLAWHERYDADPGLRWFREALARAADDR